MFVYGGVQLIKEKGKVTKKILNDLWMMNVITSSKNDDISGLWLQINFDKMPPPMKFGHFGFFLSDKIFYIGSDTDNSILCYDLSDPSNLKRMNPNSILYSDNPEDLEHLDFNFSSFGAFDIHKSTLLFTGKL